uniref:uncharacterized protein LOC122604381 n=1 Tax=Erigeron canadensis TaxID=72917 RepID=UPI001CB89928|nr:uncharacterized protein LOC122604381 [Erigeron canadensis]
MSNMMLGSNQPTTQHNPPNGYNENISLSDQHLPQAPAQMVPPVHTNNNNGSSTYFSSVTQQRFKGFECENGTLPSSSASILTQISPVISRLIDIYRRIFKRLFCEPGRRRVNLNPSTLIEEVQEDPYDFFYNGLPKKHRVLTDQAPCKHCGATRFKFKFPTFCCMSGKTKLAITNVPTELYNLYTDQTKLGKTFRHQIRAYNTNFSFTSMGVKLDKKYANMSARVYTFRVNGGIYHTLDQLVPRDGQPRYLQLYFYDPENEFNLRASWSNLDRNIFRILTRALAANPYATTFQNMAQLGPLDNYRVTLNASVELDQRVYNRPTTSEVAGIWVEGNDKITAYKRSIVVYGRSQQCQRIQPYFGCYDPLSYPLFFPAGEFRWHSRIPRNGFSLDDIGNDEDNIEQDEEAEGENTNKGRKTVTMQEYYCYKFQIRPTENVILLGGRLYQQYVVDVYIKIETTRLNFHEYNQDKIRVDLYQGIVDCVNAGEVNLSRIRRRIVLPATFIGGPRDMRRRFLDAMTLVQDADKPDLFLMFTCNPNWEEITKKLLPGQTAQDRPGLVARVFRA